MAGSLSMEYVTRLGGVADMPFEYFRQAGDAYLAAASFEQASAAYEIAIKRGLDPGYVETKRSNHPQLKR